MSAALLSTARRLALASPGKPRQSDLTRAISTAYYALFHAVARNAADMLVGTGKDRSEIAWAQAYRALDHGLAKKACSQLRNMGFPPDLSACGDAFAQLQEARQEADYDPHVRLTRADALSAIDLAERAIAQLNRSSRKDRKSFAVQLLLKRR